MQQANKIISCVQKITFFYALLFYALLHARIRRAEEMRRQDDGSDGGMEEGEVRVGALGGEGGAVWAVRLASSLVFVLLLLLCCAARCALS